jgi:hypothetical protein
VRASLRASSSVNHRTCPVCGTLTRQKSLGPHVEPRWGRCRRHHRKGPWSSGRRAGDMSGPLAWCSRGCLGSVGTWPPRLCLRCGAGPASRRRWTGCSVTDPDADADRRVWNRAHATDGPDEEVALELIGRAGRAEARGGIAATTAFLERACALHQRPGAVCGPGARRRARQVRVGRRSRRRVTARERASRATGGRGSDAPPLLLDAARRLEPLDARLAVETYLEA